MPHLFPAVRPVQLGRLDEGAGDAPHGLGQQEHRERREGAGENDGPAGAQQPQPVADQIVGHQGDLGGHQHQDHIEEKQERTHFPPPAGEAVGGDGGHRQLQQHHRHRQNHRVPEFQQVVGALDEGGDVLAEADLVGDELQVHRLGYVGLPVAAGDVGEHLAVVGADLALGHKGVGDGQHRGHQKGQGKARRQQRQGEAAEIAVLFHPSTSFPKMSSTLNSSAMSATITRAISTAAEAIFW